MNITEKTWGFKRYREWLIRRFQKKYHSDYIEKFQDNRWNITPINTVSVGTLHRKLKIPASFCIYYRVVLVYVPLHAVGNSWYTPLVVANTAVYGFILATLLNPAFAAGDAADFTLALIVVVLMFVIIGGLMFGGKILRDWGTAAWRRYRNRPVDDSPSMYKDIIKPYITSKKKHICPMVTFEEDGKVEIL